MHRCLAVALLLLVTLPCVAADEPYVTYTFSITGARSLSGSAERRDWNCSFQYGTVTSGSTDITIEFPTNGEPGTYTFGPHDNGSVVFAPLGGEGDPERDAFGLDEKDPSSRATVVARPDKSVTYTFENLGNAHREKISGHVEYRCVPGGVHADSGSYTVSRGEKVSLDGSRSTGDNLTFDWTITPRCTNEPVEGSAAPKTVQRHGRTTTVVALCPLDLQLKVTDSSGHSDTQQGKVNVNARSFSTRVSRDTPIASDTTASGSMLGGLVKEFGKNICWYSAKIADFGTASGDHWMHGDASADHGDEMPPMKTICKVDKVSDPGGPFDGWSYVSRYEGQFRRAMLVNMQLVNGDVAAYNDKHGRAAAVDRLRDSIMAHEQFHTEIALEFFDRTHDEPARIFERAISSHGSDAFDKDLNFLRNQEEFKIGGGTGGEAEVHRRMRARYGNEGTTIYVRDPDSGKWKLWNTGPFASLGDQ